MQAVSCATFTQFSLTDLPLHKQTEALNELLPSYQEFFQNNQSRFVFYRSDALSTTHLTVSKY